MSSVTNSAYGECWVPQQRSLSYQYGDQSNYSSSTEEEFSYYGDESTYSLPSEETNVQQKNVLQLSYKKSNQVSVLL